MSIANTTLQKAFGILGGRNKYIRRYNKGPIFLCSYYCLFSTLRYLDHIDQLGINILYT